MQAKEEAQIKDQLETLLKLYWEQQYEAAQQDVEYSGKFLDKYMVPRDQFRNVESPTLPDAVQEAANYYLENVEAHDWGTVRLYLVPIDEHEVYLVRVTTDGDDGWVELFSAEGDPIGVGRTYLELVNWGDKEEIRNMVATGDFPPGLTDREQRTLWNKPDSKSAGNE